MIKIKTKSFLKIWTICSILWFIAVSSQLYQHYLPLFEQSNFIYNPMVSPNKLLIANDDNKKMLERTFMDEWHNIYSFGIPGMVDISISKKYYKGDTFETWMPDGTSITSVSTKSPGWLEFKSKLTNDALRLREELSEKIYSQYVLKDTVLIFGAPLVFLLGFVASKTMWRLRRVRKGLQD